MGVSRGRGYRTLNVSRLMGVPPQDVARLAQVSPGDAVKKGDPLFTLDDREIQRIFARLEQAVLVARAHDIDLVEIKRWSRAEGMQDAFAAIANRFA